MFGLKTETLTDQNFMSGGKINPAAIGNIKDDLRALKEYCGGVALGPAENTDGNIPQWDGSNSKTLKDGFTIAALAIEIGKLLFPIGSYYMNETDNTNPGTLLGFGTWAAVQAVVPVGYKSGDAEFGAAGTEVGAKTVALTAANLPSMNIYTSSGYPVTFATGGTNIRLTYTTDGGDISGVRPVTYNGTTAHGNIQPSRVVYMWRRTA